MMVLSLHALLSGEELCEWKEGKEGERRERRREEGRREAEKEQEEVCEGGKQRRRKGVYFNSITQECHISGGSFSCRVMRGMVVITGVT